MLFYNHELCPWAKSAGIMLEFIEVYVTIDASEVESHCLT